MIAMSAIQTVSIHAMKKYTVDKTCVCARMWRLFHIPCENGDPDGQENQ